MFRSGRLDLHLIYLQVNCTRVNVVVVVAKLAVVLSDDRGILIFLLLLISNVKIFIFKMAATRRTCTMTGLRSKFLLFIFAFIFFAFGNLLLSQAHFVLGEEGFYKCEAFSRLVTLQIRRKVSNEFLVLLE